MEFKHLNSYVTVVKLQSFSKAAQILNISQPSISTHIQLLEGELGVALLNRNAKSFEVTEIGKEIYEYACNIIQMKDKLMNCCSSEEQTIHIGASTIPSAYVLPEVIPEFTAMFPDISFSIHQSDSKGIMEALEDGLYDIGLVGQLYHDSRFHFDPICSDTMVLITPNTEPFCSMDKDDPDYGRILSYPVILREQGSGSGSHMTKLLDFIGKKEDSLKIIARVNDQEAVNNMVANKMGIACVSSRAAKKAENVGKLISFPIPEVYANRKLYLVYNDKKITKEYIQNFIQFLKNWKESENVHE